MKPAVSLRNLMPSSTAELSAVVTLAGVAVLGQIVHGQAALAAAAGARPTAAAVIRAAIVRRRKRDTGSPHEKTTSTQ
jgi:hypothetical protein